MSNQVSKIYELINGHWEPTGAAPGQPTRPNFLIACEYGDWSGFRTLADCVKQIPRTGKDVPAGFYWIEER